MVAGMGWTSRLPRAFGGPRTVGRHAEILCLVGALLGYRMPSLIAFNEPEASLHPTLIPRWPG